MRSQHDPGTKRSHGGFTFNEILVVVVIIGAFR